MEKYVIKGGNPLVGEVEIGGAKNAALAILAAATMTDETVYIDNMPDASDTNAMLQAIESIGAFVERTGRHSVKINASQIKNHTIENDYIKKIRAGYYLLGALLGKYKDAGVALPGGCHIGLRPIDQHIKGFTALGAKVNIQNIIYAKADKLVGSHIYLDVVSVGATINIMMAAVMAEGKTIIENAAKEPHVVDIANFLNSMGANIKGAGTDVIRIKGVEKLHGTEYSVIPDQIEAGTFMFAAATTKGDILVKNVIPKHLEATSAKLIEAGCVIEEYDDAVRVIGKGRKHNTVYLNDNAQISLGDYLKERQGDSEYIFVSDRKPHGKLSVRAVEVLIKTLGKEIGVETLSPHILRHTSATLALQSGMPLTQVQKMLGHASPNTTQIYAETSQSDIATSHQRYVV